MNKLALLLIPLLFFMTSCSIDWNGEKDKKIAELEKQIQDDTFKKKQECISLEPEMMKQLESVDKYGERVNGTSLIITEIFYSPLEKSCIYKSEFSVGNNMVQLRVNNYMTKETLFEKNCNVSKESISSGNFTICSDEFKNKLNEFKLGFPENDPLGIR